MEKEKTEEKSVLYNFGASHLDMIIGLIRDGCTARNEGDSLSYYNKLKSIKTQVIPRLSAHQKIILNAIEERANMIIKEQEPTEYESFNVEEKRLDQLNKKLIPILICYDEKIMT